MAADIPESLHLVESFANSLDVDTAQDDLESPARFGRWMAAHGFPGAEVGDRELGLALGMRDALRAELIAHHDNLGSSPARARLEGFAERIPLRASFAGAGPATLVPAGEGVTAMLGAVLAAMVLAEREGGWHRLKICREETCQRVFFDKSKNQSKTWCSMQVCGNRSKTRTYRDRLRDTTLPPLPERPPPPRPVRRVQPAPLDQTSLPPLPPVPPAP